MELAEVHTSHQPLCAARLDKVFRGYLSIQLISAGSVDLRRTDADGTHRWRLERDWMWYCYPGPRFAFRSHLPEGTWEHRHLAFTGKQAFDWIARGLIIADPFPAPEGTDWAARFDEARHCAASGDWLGAQRFANRVEAIVLDLAQAAISPTAEGPAWLHQVISTLSGADGTALEEPIAYEALALRVGMGTSTLRRKFTAATGTTLHAYRIACRIAEGRRLLAGSELPLNVIARRCGYCDAFAFSRAFTHHTGSSPAAFRTHYAQFTQQGEDG